MKIQAQGDYLLLKATTKGVQTPSGIIIDTNLSKSTPTKDKRIMIDKIEVISIGLDVKEVKVGDTVIPQGYVLNQVIPAENIGEKHDPEKEQWYWAKEEHIILTIK